MESQRVRATEHACLHMPWDGLCTLSGVVGSSCQMAEAPLCHPWPRGTRLLWAPSSLTPRAPSRQHPTLCESGQAWAPGKCCPGSLSPETSRRTAKDSQGQPRSARATPSEAGGGHAKLPWQLRGWARLLSNYIVLQTRQNRVS